MPNSIEGKIQNSVILAGLGLSGLITACLFAKHDFLVQCFDPKLINKKDFPLDKRTTACLNPAIDIFKLIGVWEKLEPFAQPLSKMEIIDVSRNQNSTPTKTVFDAREISLTEFGFNIPNDKIANILLDYLKKKKTVKLNFGDQIISHYGFDHSVSATTNKGKQISGNLLIACDGKNSKIRGKENIKTLKTSYDQLALVFQVTHSTKHNNVTTEILDKGGPFTIIPLRDNNECNSSTIVWMDYSKNIKELVNFSAKKFNYLLQKKSLNLRGNIKFTGEKQIWPIMTQISSKLYGKRVAIIAESAHVMPPTGAQGLNTSVEDIATLFRLCMEAKKDNKDIGSREILRSYNKERLKTVGVKVAGMHVLNKISMTHSTKLQNFRKATLSLISKNETIRHFLMNIGVKSKSI